jgi:hypothetical protein
MIVFDEKVREKVQRAPTKRPARSVLRSRPNRSRNPISSAPELPTSTVIHAQSVWVSLSGHRRNSHKTSGENAQMEYGATHDTYWLRSGSQPASVALASDFPASAPQQVVNAESQAARWQSSGSLPALNRSVLTTSFIPTHRVPQVDELVAIVDAEFGEEPIEVALYRPH